jgi:2-oxoglutarate ferredoxin oxidoreductase subunit alpha
MNLANIHNVPVIVLSDKMLCESSKNVVDLEKEKEEIIESKKIIPGKGIYLYNSYEHNEEGFSIEDGKEAKKAVEKRLAKINKIISDLPKVNFFGSEKATKLVVGWGSTKGAILEALRGKEDYAFMQIISLWPINKDIGVVINSFKEKILVENNATGQLGKLLKMETGVEFDKTILKYDGRPFFPYELKEELK